MYITYKRNVGVGLLCTRRSDKNLSALNINGEKTVQESQQWCTSKNDRMLITQEIHICD